MAIIHAVGTALPDYLLKQNDAKQLIEPMIKNTRLKKYLSVFDHAHIDERYFVVDKSWFSQPHSFQERNDLFMKQSLKLIKKAIDECFEQTDMTYHDVDAIISVTSTGILTPTIEVHIMNELPFKDDVVRIPMFGLGCAGGGIGLSRAYDFLKAYPHKTVLVIAVELATIAFHHHNLMPKDVVGAALFSDGAGAVLLVGDDHPNHQKRSKDLSIKSTSSKLLKQTMNVMGWDVKDDGLHVIFSVDIPKLIPTFWAEHLQQFLNQNNLKMAEIENILAHPGGKKVIEKMEEQLEDSQSVQFTKYVLKKYGNMSSPTLFFVLKEALKNKNDTFKKTYHLLTALGPGFTSEMLLLEWA